MNIKDLLESIKTDKCGFTSKVDNIDNYYLVKISMDENVYRHQSAFYMLFSHTDDADAMQLTLANLKMNYYFFNTHILGTKDDNGIFKPLNENSFEDKEYSTNKHDQLYVRDYAMQTKLIANVEVITYG